MRINHAFIAASVLSALIGGCAGQKAEPKLLQFGWGTPMAETLPSRINKMESYNPFFDAFIVGVKLRGDVEARSGRPGWEGRFCSCVFGAGKVRWENVSQDVASLRQAADKAKRIEMFLRFNVVPGNVDWFDPAWESIVHNAAVTGRMAREGGCTGLVFDIEEYGKPRYNQGKPFRYVYQPQRKDHTFAEYAQQARKRGRQWIEAFQAASPRAVIIFMWAHSYYTYAQWRRDGGKLVWDKPLKPQDTGYLLAPFIDGIIEGAGPGIELYDGAEYTYGFRTKEDFALARRFVEEGWRYSTVPDLYRKKMKAAFATEMDRTWRTRGGFYPDEPEKNYYTPEKLAMALHFSMAASDGYSWVYSEAPRWWPHKKLSKAYLRAFAEAHTDRPFGIDPDQYSRMSIARPAVAEAGPPRAVDIRGPDPEVLFRRYWAKHSLLMDLPLKAKFKTDPKEIGTTGQWFAESLDDSAWNNIRVDEFWEAQGHPRYDAYAWYRLRFAVPGDLPAGKKLYLAFGACDEAATVWLNGQQVGEHTGPWNRPFLIDVTSAIRPGERNLLSMRVFGGFGAGGLWAPIKLIAQE